MGNTVAVTGIAQTGTNTVGTLTTQGDRGQCQDDEEHQGQSQEDQGQHPHGVEDWWAAILILGLK